MSGSDVESPGNEGTDLDSDPVEEVDSDEDFSRLIKTPSSQRGARAQNRSTPRSRRSPTRQPDNSGPGRAARESQPTQQVAPLTASQLDRLMGGLSDEDGEINSSSENEYDARRAEHAPESSSAPKVQFEGSPIDRFRDERPANHADQLDQTDHADQTDQTDQTDQADQTGELNQVPASYSPDDANTTPGSVSVAVVEETPVRTLSQHFAYLLVKFGNDPRWWPCRARLEDWKTSNKRATVLFRDDEIGVVDLSHCFELRLKPEDPVHVMKRQGRFKIERLAESTAFAVALCTATGANMATIGNAKRSVDVPIADLYFTDADLKEIGMLPLHSAKKKRHRDDPNNSGVDAANGSRANDSRSDSKNDSRNDSKLRGDVTPRRRSRPVFIASPGDSIEEIRSSPVSPMRGSPRSGSASPQHGTYLHDIQFDRSPPRKRRDLTAGLRRQNPKGIFGDCVFTISLDTSGKSELEEWIVQNGGRVLRDGLGELVSLSEFDEDGSMPDLVIGNALETTTFAAVITDEPRRTVKYLEMVALGWPCLHLKYVFDCVEQGAVLDWLPYLLPAGISTVPGRLMPVNANVQAFHAGWLENLNLKEQIRRRKIVIKCTVPFCLVRSAKSHSSLLLLATLCAPQFRTWIYSHESQVPEGSLMVDLVKQDAASFAVAPPQLLYQIQNYASLDRTVKRNKEWLIQSIISGCLV